MLICGAHHALAGSMRLGTRRGGYLEPIPEGLAPECRELRLARSRKDGWFLSLSSES